MSLPVCRPLRLPTAIAATTRASQRATARPGWVALQRARRTVTGRRTISGESAGGAGSVDTAVPFAGGSLTSLTLVRITGVHRGGAPPPTVEFSPPPGGDRWVRMDPC